MSYVLTRTLPSGQEKTGTMQWQRWQSAAREAARCHWDNSGGACGRKGMSEVFEALLNASPGETVGPFRDYSYRIDEK